MGWRHAAAIMELHERGLSPREMRLLHEEWRLADIEATLAAHGVTPHADREWITRYGEAGAPRKVQRWPYLPPMKAGKNVEIREAADRPLTRRRGRHRGVARGRVKAVRDAIAVYDAAMAAEPRPPLDLRAEGVTDRIGA